MLKHQVAAKSYFLFYLPGTRILMSITFAVDNVKPSTPHLHLNNKFKELYLKEGLVPAGIKNGKVEAYKMNADNVRFQNATTNSFVYTALEAFSDHSPFAIAPDDIWLLVVQAVSKHISLNPEDCRRAIVNWDGKKVIQVVNDDFYKGSPDNDWPREFGNFASQIKALIGNREDLFNPTFSTTGPIEKAAIQVQMMAALAPYFEYRMMTLCGVPTVTLLGTPEDWKAISTRVAAFGEFYPKWAHHPLIEAVVRFEESSRGQHDLEFWRNFFKRSYGSGGTTINGWIAAFFPYMNDKQNKMMSQTSFWDAVRKDARAGYDIGDFTSSVSTAPMHWNCRGTEYEMALVSGMMGTTVIDVDGVSAYKTVIGWAVGEAK